MFNFSVNSKDTKKVAHILESSLEIFFLMQYQVSISSINIKYQLSEIKDDIQIFSQFPCLLGCMTRVEHQGWAPAHFSESEAEFKEFEPRLKSAKTRLKLSAGLNLWYNFKWNQPYLSRGLNLSHRLNSLNSASDLVIKSASIK